MSSEEKNSKCHPVLTYSSETSYQTNRLQEDPRDFCYLSFLKRKKVCAPGTCIPKSRLEQEKLVTSTRPDAQGWLVGVERSSDSDKSKTGKPTGAFVYLNYQDRKSDKEVVNPQMVKELEFLLSNLPEKQDELQTFLSQFKTNDPKYVKIIPIVIQNLFDNGCNLEDLNLKLQNLDFANISFLRVQLKKHIKKEKARQELYLELGDISQTKLANAIEQISRVPGGLKAVLEAMARGPKVMARLGLDIDQKTLLALEKLAAKGNTKGHELLKYIESMDNI